MAHSPAYNPYFGCRLRGLLEEACLADIGNEGTTRIARGGEPVAKGMLVAFQAYMERGLLSQAELAELQKVYSDPSFRYITATMFAAWEKRAS